MHKEKISGIYSIQNIKNKKRYIGQSRDIYERWKSHRYSYKNNKNKSKIYLAIREYGIENFIFEILEEIKEENLNDRELYWIEVYDSINNGYNSSIVGYGKTPIICLETLDIFDSEIDACQKYSMSISTLSSCLTNKKNRKKCNGKTWMFLSEYSEKSAKEKLKISNEKRGLIGEKNPMYGMIGNKHPSYGKKREDIVGEKNPSSKSVICKTTGKIFNTMKEASEYYKTDLSHICSCCRGRLKHSGKLSDGTKLEWMYCVRD